MNNATVVTLAPPVVSQTFVAVIPPETFSHLVASLSSMCMTARLAVSPRIARKRALARRALARAHRRGDLRRVSKWAHISVALWMCRPLKSRRRAARIKKGLKS